MYFKSLTASSLQNKAVSLRSTRLNISKQENNVYELGENVTVIVLSYDFYIEVLVLSSLHVINIVQGEHRISDLPTRLTIPAVIRFWL